MTVLTSTEVEVTWEPPDLINQNDLRIELYYVRVLQSTFSEIPFIRLVNSTGASRSLTVTGLEENVLHTVCVLARNSQGNGPCSPNITERTFEDSKFNIDTCEFLATCILLSIHSHTHTKLVVLFIDY